MKSIVFRVLAVSVLLAVAGIAQAQSRATGIAWTYVEAAYQNTEYDLGPFGKPDGGGALLAGSLGIGDFMHAFGSWQQSQLDSPFSDVDQYEVGFGFHTPLTQGDSTRLYSDRFSAFFNAQYLNLDSSGSEDGWGLDAGYMYVDFDDRKIDSSVPFGSYGDDPNGTDAYNGKYEANVHLFGLGVTKRFE